MGGEMDPIDIDFLNADRFSAMGDAPVLIVDAARWKPPIADIQAVRIGVDYDGQLPIVAAADFDLLVTTADNAPAPWASVLPERLDAELDQLQAAVRAFPVAATTLCAVLCIGEALDFEQGLKIESLAYSALLSGAEFARWRSSTPVESVAVQDQPMVLTERDTDVVILTLNHASAQNAMSAAMRDGLYAALANVLDDPSEPHLLLQGAGKCFSTGGALGEFGTASDLAQAHVVRTLRSCTGLLDRLGGRASVLLHGACVGSGLEVPAAAAHRAAKQSSWFQLPELKMGLIPGAGGTVSVRRAIGRHRTVWMLLTGKRISAQQALAWGLVHEIVA